ncbi:hypothetical protein HK102_001593 [Quaeritorhiza haematococci]|nr:hypothetical protein HK102_001593 [Quaeritorhiza haematococci]
MIITFYALISVFRRIKSIRDSIVKSESSKGERTTAKAERSAGTDTNSAAAVRERNLKMIQDLRPANACFQIATSKTSSKTPIVEGRI